MTNLKGHLCIFLCCRRAECSLLSDTHTEMDSAEEAGGGRSKTMLVTKVVQRMCLQRQAVPALRRVITSSIPEGTLQSNKRTRSPLSVTPLRGLSPRRDPQPRGTPYLPPSVNWFVVPRKNAFISLSVFPSLSGDAHLLFEVVEKRIAGFATSIAGVFCRGVDFTLFGRGWGFLGFLLPGLGRGSSMEISLHVTAPSSKG
jgi:hypothetical protein